MTKISAHTLMMAIQAVDIKLNDLAQKINDADAEEPGLENLETFMLDFSTAETELKSVYIEMQQESDNLPPYDSLVSS
jgi:hypothetical protein